jgi:hypothetical protein
LDDTLVFSAKMTIEIQDGPTFHLVLRAQGEGSTIISSEPLNTIDLGSQVTNKFCQKEFTLHNKGRRPQTVTWVNEKAKRNRKVLRQEEEESFIFTISPETVTLQPGASQKFTLKGFSPVPERVAERLYCNGVVDKVSNLLFESDVTCKFDDPLLQLPNNVAFVWNYKPGSEPSRQVIFIFWIFLTSVDKKHRHQKCFIFSD